MSNFANKLAAANKLATAKQAEKADKGAAVRRPGERAWAVIVRMFLDNPAGLHISEVTVHDDNDLELFGKLGTANDVTSWTRVNDAVNALEAWGLATANITGAPGASRHVKITFADKATMRAAVNKTLARTMPPNHFVAPSAADQRKRNAAK